VMGHGVDAALIMATARTFLHLNASQCGNTAQVVSGLNRHLALDVLDTSRFMTLFFIKVDPIGNKLSWVWAGHDPALLYDPEEDRFVELRGTGMALGIDENYEYSENTFTGLRCGQIITIGTDGIWEALDRSGKMFGKKRLRQIIRETSQLDATGVLDSIFDSLNTFLSGQRQNDDSTFVVIKITKKPKSIDNWEI